MSRRPALATLGCATALLVATFSSGPAVSAPTDQPRTSFDARGQSRAQDPGPPQGDVDGDRVSDDFAPRLRAAAPGQRFAVIVTGLRAGRAMDAVGRFDVTHRLPIIDGFSAVMTAGQARALARRPEVRRVSADGRVQALDDAGNRDFGVTDARAERAGVDGSGVGVCVVDTGVDAGHEQLAGRLVGFFDAVNGRTTAYDDHGHGTHVAGIALGDGTGSNASAAAGAGVAPAAALYAAKVLDGSGYGSDSQVLAGVQWCTEQSGVRVISMSLGDTAASDGTDPLSEAVDSAVAGGDVVVVAAGNSGDGPQTINAPGVAARAITVGAASDWSAPTGTARHDDGIWLAAFSSRGPALRPGNATAVKPDVVAPGVSVTAADAGTVSGYVTMSGTSMATPFVAGAVALALDADPTTTPDDIKAALTGTAADRGVGGPDNEWGAGLVDVRAFVDAVVDGAADQWTAFPTAWRSSLRVPGGGYADLPIAVGTDGLGQPLAITATITSGGPVCLWGCLFVEWSPDLDMDLRSPTGSVLAVSECTLDGVSCGMGRQETIGIRPGVAGTYMLRVYAYGGGTGGTVEVDVSQGPLAGSTPTPDPTPTNVAPTANAGSDRVVRVNKKTKRATFTLDGSGSTDPDGSIVSYAWALGGAAAGAGATLQQTKPPGTYVYTLTVTDNRGATGTDTVTITVR